MQARSRVLIDNDRCIVNEWRMRRGESTGFHTHERDYVVVPVTTGRLRVTGADGRAAERDREAGTPHAGLAGTAHDVECVSDGEYVFLEIEFK